MIVDFYSNKIKLVKSPNNKPESGIMVIFPCQVDSVVLTQTQEIKGNLAEWLRRKIRNLLGFARAGSSPAVVVFYQNFLNLFNFTLIVPERQCDRKE